MQLALDVPTRAATSWFTEMSDSLGFDADRAWPDRFGEALRGWFESQTGDSPETLSLFSGGGGLDIAFHDAGFAVRYAVEISPKYVATLEANSARGGYLEGLEPICQDIAQFEPASDFRPRLIIGGPPCQTFSAAGRRAAGVMGMDDPRGRLFIEYARLLETLQPEGFLFENVYGITGAQGGLVWRSILETFAELGYTVAHRVLDAADYGVPQHRE